MKFHRVTAEIFVPDGLAVPQALARTTHLAIAAHQDDLEIMAASPILECFQHPDKWFGGVVVADGRGSPRSGVYEKYNDDQMRLVRNQEQRKAAVLGEYSFQILLDYPSKVIKDSASREVVEDLAAVIQACQPESIYTHNLADKHDTHVAVALRVIAAIRSLPKSMRPKRLFGCEVWRGLDWLVDSDKVVFDLSSQENLQAALLGVFDSQISGGKRYDLAALARRRANATYYESHNVDVSTALSFGMDMTQLIIDDTLDPAEAVRALINRLLSDVTERIHRMAG